MRTFCKHFFAFATAFVMVFTFTAVASAVDVSESNSPSLYVESFSEGSTRDVKYIRYGDTLDGINPYQGTFTLNTAQYATIVIKSDTSCKVEIVATGNTGIAQSRSFAAGTNGTYTIGAKLPAGTYFYNIVMGNGNAQYAFQLITSDYSYN